MSGCPYCGATVKISHDDGYGYEEDELYQQDCRECGKTFVYDTCITFYHTTHKADCLNGGKHVWKKTITFPVEFARMRCTLCGEEKPIKRTKKCHTK